MARTVVVLEDGAHMQRLLRQEWLGSGVTLREVAGRMGLSAPQEVSPLLDGSRDMRVSTAIRLARALGVRLALTEADEPHCVDIG